ncbi:MAG TPA: protoporphyrinogen oxidase [Terriglobales bacterium]|jgi:oxygen-dependent protoporphyrinogen oxidase|nr:protoporphyrinogen oxidase [Terriglobales bacterium]
MKRIAIIGGGISGLSAAFHLEKARATGADLEYTLFESGTRLGGCLASDRIEGCLVEAGPDSFLTEKPWALTLCKELGIDDQLIGSNDSQRKTYIVVHGKLVVMPDGLMFMVPTKLMPTALSPLFSWSTKLRMARELLHPPRPMQEDETVAQLVERHFGAEVVDRLADPLLSGVYGGDAAKLSARAVLPRFVEMEEKYGSLSQAMLAAHKKMAELSKAQPPRPLFTSLKDGMQHLVDAIVGRLNGDAIRLRRHVRRIYPENGGWRVSLEMNGDERYDAIILATPANVAGELLDAVDRGLAQNLLDVTYSSSVTVTMGYYKQQLEKLPPGFGFLVPRSEGRRMLACTFVHNKFPHRAPQDKGILRCFLGGARDEAVLSLSDDEILQTVQRELRELVKLEHRPIFSRVYRWRSAMAQYEPGHIARVADIEKRVSEIPGLAVAGNAYHGIGVPDCIRSGKEAAESVMQFTPESQTARR